MTVRERPAAAVVVGSVGILGGTFDPIHLGHLAIGEEVREVLGLERVLFVPAAEPPHKRDRRHSDPEHRLAMVRLAVADNPAFEASGIELERDGPSYSADTLSELHRRAADEGRSADLTFILSGEALRGLPDWHDPVRILTLARLAVVPRHGSTMPDRGWVAERFPGLEDRVAFLSGPLLAISGTAVRARVAAGRSIRYLVPDAVRRYIDDHGLYHDQRWRDDPT